MMITAISHPSDNSTALARVRRVSLEFLRAIIILVAAFLIVGRGIEVIHQLDWVSAFAVTYTLIVLSSREGVHAGLMTRVSVALLGFAWLGLGTAALAEPADQGQFRIGDLALFTIGMVCVRLAWLDRGEQQGASLR